MNKIEPTLEQFCKTLGQMTGYRDVCIKGDAGVCAIMPLAFTHAIVSECNLFGYEDRWCFHSYEAAKAAYDAWDGAEGTEPTGWHRHPNTGRRIDLETGKMEINF